MKNIYSSEPAKITDIKKHTDIDWSFKLDSKFHALPGQFVIVSIPGFGEAPISISGIHNKSFELTIRNVGKVTSGIFKLKNHDSLFIRGPYGNGFPFEKFTGKHLLVISGGSGMAAVKSLIEFFMENSKELKKLTILCGFKSSKHVLFQKELKMWKKNCNLLTTVDTHDHENENEIWEGGIGFVVDHIKGVKHIDDTTNVVMVGPPLMMKNTVKELLRNNIKEENIWLSFERHMKCGMGKCGHCRIRDTYVCIDGPVYNYIEAKELID